MGPGGRGDENFPKIAVGTIRPHSGHWSNPVNDSDLFHFVSSRVREAGRKRDHAGPGRLIKVLTSAFFHGGTLLISSIQGSAWGQGV